MPVGKQKFTRTSADTSKKKFSRTSADTSHIAQISCLEQYINEEVNLYKMKIFRNCIILENIT